MAKGVDHQLRDIDPFLDKDADRLWRYHPFLRVPILDHDGLRVFETSAISRCVDLAFEGTFSSSGDARAQARITQCMAVIGAYGYRPMIRQVFEHRVFRPREGLACDEAEVAAGAPRMPSAQAPGVTPSIRRKRRVRCEWSAKPHATATSAGAPPAASMRRLPGGAAKAPEELNATQVRGRREVPGLLIELQRRIRLMRRDGPGLYLTHDGERLVDRLGKGLATLRAGVEQLMDAAAKRPVHVTLSTGFAAGWLTHRLGGFRAQRPDIEPMLNPTTTVIDLSRSEFEFGIRYGRGAWDGVEAERLSVSPTVVVGTPALVARIGIRTPEHLLRAPWVEEICLRDMGRRAGGPRRNAGRQAGRAASACAHGARRVPRRPRRRPDHATAPGERSRRRAARSAVRRGSLGAGRGLLACPTTRPLGSDSGGLRGVAASRSRTGLGARIRAQRSDEDAHSVMLESGARLPDRDGAVYPGRDLVVGHVAGRRVYRRADGTVLGGAD